MNVEAERVLSTFVDSSTDFSLELFRRTDATKSVVLSPFSINMALCLVHSGAMENTEEQMRNIMIKGSSAADLSLYFSTLLKEITSAKKIDFYVANIYYMRIGLSPYEDYLAKIRTNYLADAVTIDFKDAAAASEEINKFVSECTKKKIEKVVTPEFVEDAASMVVNALYLKADWEQKFCKRDTDTLPFNVDENNEKMIPFMRQTDYFYYYENADVKALTMEYSNNNFSFTAILPNKKFGFIELRNSLTGKKLQEILQGGKSRRVKVTLPKMTIEYEMDLKEVLKSCGMTDMFDINKANLRATCTDDLYCSEAIHKAIIENRLFPGQCAGNLALVTDYILTKQVDEEGTTAAAVTVIKSVSRERPPKAVEFCANYPFMFVLSYKNNTVFIGQFVPEGAAVINRDENRTSINENEDDSVSDEELRDRRQASKPNLGSLRCGSRGMLLIYNL